MKKTIFIVFLILAATHVFALSGRPVTYGIHLTFGGRYDNVRMCVGSSKGVKGGPIMDVYFDVRFPVGDDGTLALNIPVMRPILFGAAFGMLQFEPQLTYEHRFGSSGGIRPVLGAGLGVVFHYGPDYQSSKEDRGKDFFAVGPLISGSFGVEIEGKRGFWTPGLKVFYAPLFSPDYDSGTILGGAAELHYSFKP